MLNISNRDYVDTFLDKWEYEDNDSIKVITEDRDISRKLVIIDDLIERFEISCVNFRPSDKRRRCDGEIIYQIILHGENYSHRLGNDVVRNFFKHYRLMKDYRGRGLFSVRTFSPNITAYLQWMDQVDRTVTEFEKLINIRSTQCREFYRVNYHELENRVYQCFSELAEKLKHPEFIRLKQQIKKSCDKNNKSIKSYINGLFESRSRLLFVRIDLGYSKAHNTKMEKLITSSKDVKNKVDEFEQVRSDIDRLLSNKRHNKIFNGLLGYVWKLEYGIQRRYHYHALLIFDSSKHCRDVAIARNVGEYWVNVITPGRGAYFNVNGSKIRYKFNALGQVHCTDCDARKGLDLIVQYFSKPDYFMRLDLSKLVGDKKGMSYRTMGKGQAKGASAVKRGRPRNIGLIQQ